MQSLIMVVLFIVIAETIFLGVLANAYLNLRRDTTQFAATVRKCLQSITRDHTSSLMKEKGIPGTPENLWKAVGLRDEETEG